MGKWDIVQVFLASPSLNMDLQCSQGMSIFFNLIEHPIQKLSVAQVPVYQALLEQLGANETQRPSVDVSTGASPLHLASKRGNLLAVEYLMRSQRTPVDPLTM